MTPQIQGADVRRRTVNPTVSLDDLAGLDLAQLRTYRHGLEDEEERVSYWRRLVHARIDVIVAESGAAGPLGIDDLVRVLGDTGSGRSRRALVGFRVGAPLPDLPVLEEMWVTDVDPHDQDQVEGALQRLRTAEVQLTAYRQALHQHIEDATGELVLRYRADPAAALVLIPEDR